MDPSITPPELIASVTALATPLVRAMESCRLVAYPDPISERAAALRLPETQRPALWWRRPGSPWTCGWGHTGPEVTEGVTWSQEHCDDVLEDDLIHAATWAYKLVHLPYATHVFAALTSLIMNIGEEEFAGSTMHRMLVTGTSDTAAFEFPRWDHAKGREVEGLLKRRYAEQAMFLGKDWQQAAADFEASHAS